MKTNLSINKKIWLLTRNHRLAFLNLALCDIVAPLLGMIYPLLLSTLIDEVVYRSSTELFPVIFAGYIIVYITSTALYWIQQCTLAYLNTNFLFHIRSQLLDAFLRTKSSVLKSTSIGDQIATINSDTSEIINFLHINVFYPISSIVRTIFVLYILINYNLLLSVIMIVCVLASVRIGLVLSKKMKEKQGEVRFEYGSFIAKVFEFIQGLHEIKFLSAESRVKGILQNNMKRLNHSKLHVMRYEYKVTSILSLITTLSDIVLYVVSTLMIVFGQLTLGMFLVIVDYYKNITRFLKNLSNVYTDIQKNFVAIERVFRMLDSDQECMVDEGTIMTNTDIIFEGVDFKFDNESIFKHLTLSIMEKDKITIVGKSGSGKTTLVNLILRLFEPDTGSIYVGDKNINSYGLEYLRKNVGLVEQNTVIFDESIRYNLTLGDSTYTEAQIWDACDKAQIGAYFRSLPNKLDTWLSARDDGIELSGGEKQRVGLARIFLRDTPILLIDEATSALDVNTEMSVVSAINELAAGRTVITISHRLHSILNAEKIVFISEKRIVTVDTHEKLLLNSDEYRKYINNIC